MHNTAPISFFLRNQVDTTRLTHVTVILQTFPATFRRTIRDGQDVRSRVPGLSHPTNGAVSVLSQHQSVTTRIILTETWHSGMALNVPNVSILKSCSLQGRTLEIVDLHRVYERNHYLITRSASDCIPWTRAHFKIQIRFGRVRFARRLSHYPTTRTTRSAPFSPNATLPISENPIQFENDSPPGTLISIFSGK